MGLGNTEAGTGTMERQAPQLIGVRTFVKPGREIWKTEQFLDSLKKPMQIKQKPGKNIGIAR